MALVHHPGGGDPDRVAEEVERDGVEEVARRARATRQLSGVIVARRVRRVRLVGGNDGRNWTRRRGRRGERAGRERGRRGRGHDALRGDRRHLAKYTRTRGGRPGGWVPRRGHAGGGREGEGREGEPARGGGGSGARGGRAARFRERREGVRRGARRDRATTASGRRRKRTGRAVFFLEVTTAKFLLVTRRSTV